MHSLRHDFIRRDDWRPNVDSLRINPWARKLFDSQSTWMLRKHRPFTAGAKLAYNVAEPVTGLSPVGVQDGGLLSSR